MHASDGTTAMLDAPAGRAMIRPAVAIVAPSLEILGGQGIQAAALLDGLRGEGYEARLLPINPSFPAGLRWLRRHRFIRTLVNQTLYLPSLLGLRRADVAHVFSASYWSFLISPLPALLAGRLLGKRVILNYHSGEAEDHLARWGILVHPWLRLAHEVVVPSEYLQSVFRRFGYHARVIRNVVDTERFAYRERAPLRPRLLSARNLEPHYGVDDVLRAFALVKARYPAASLTVAGYGSEEPRLRGLAASLGVDGIDFVGRTAPAAMPALYQACDIFVNASRVDNQPVSVLEAFAAGLPVVSSGTGDIANMVRDGETGTIVPTGDPAAMAAAVGALLDDPARALELARRARREVDRYTWPAVRGQWVALYARSAA
jgi:L-malate glycosyltransferase